LWWGEREKGCKWWFERGAGGCGEREMRGKKEE